MTGRERVHAALTFNRPDRAPRDLWPLPYVSLFRQKELRELLAVYPLDLERPDSSPGSDDSGLNHLTKPGIYTDEWGSVWETGEPGIIGEVKRPALADWSSLSTYVPPWHLVRNRSLEAANRHCARSSSFMLSPVCARVFERLQFLRGSEGTFIDLADRPPELLKLIEMIHEYYLTDVRNWARSEVDAVFLMDDWGANKALLINPIIWREIFKPLYREYCDIIHSFGKFVFFHSDGNIEAILEDLVEIGVNAINTQIFCMNIEELARRYRGRITFWGEIDRQRVLPFGSPADVRAAVQRVRKALDDGTGGVIAQCEWGKDNPRENIEAVFRAWLD